jgi:hypothetical protein
MEAVVDVNAFYTVWVRMSRILLAEPRSVASGVFVVRSDGMKFGIDAFGRL